MTCVLLLSAAVIASISLQDWKQPNPPSLIDCRYCTTVVNTSWLHGPLIWEYPGMHGASICDTQLTFEAFYILQNESKCHRSNAHHLEMDSIRAAGYLKSRTTWNSVSNHLKPPSLSPPHQLFKRIRTVDVLPVWVWGLEVICWMLSVMHHYRMFHTRDCVWCSQRGMIEDHDRPVLANHDRLGTGVSDV